jgi:hypothetical protein
MPEPVAVTRARNRLMRSIQGEFCDLELPTEREALADWLEQYATNYADVVHGRELGSEVPVAEAVCDIEAEPDMRAYLPELN